MTVSLQLIVIDETDTVETYPPIPCVPTAATSRVAAPAASVESSFSSVTVDPLTATTAAALQGATAIDVSFAAVVDDLESSTLVDCASPQTVDTATLAPNASYTVVVDFSLFLVSLSETCSGQLTATVTTDGDSVTIVSQSTNYTAQGAHINTVALTSSGLDLVTQVSGDLAGDIQRGGGGVHLVATPSAGVDFVDGRLYLVSPADGSTPFVVEAAEDGQPATLSIREPLPKDIGAGSVINGIRMARTITSTSSIGDGTVEWKATLAGHAARWLMPFRVTTRTEGYRLTGTELVGLSPYSASRRPDDDDDYSRSIKAAWVRYMAPALERKGIRTERIASWAQMNAAHVAAVEHHLARTFESDADVRAEKLADFTEALDQALESIDSWQTHEEDVPSPPAPDSQPSWSSTEVSR